MEERGEDDSPTRLAKLKQVIRRIFHLDWTPVELLRDFEESLTTFYIKTVPTPDSRYVSYVSPWKSKGQLVLIIALLGYGVPIHLLQGSLYVLSDGPDKDYFRSLIADRLGYFGTPGIFLNYTLAAFMFFTTIDKCYLRKFEKDNAIEFLNDLSRFGSKDSFFGLRELEKETLLSQLKWKLILCRVNLLGTVFMGSVVEVVGLARFYVKHTVSAIIVVNTIIQFFITWILAILFINHFFLVYLSYIMTTDCVAARIHSLIERLKVKTRDHVFREILNDVDDLRCSVTKYRRTLRPLLRNLMYLSKTGLCFIFVVSGLNMSFIVKTLIVVPVLSAASTVMFTAYYVSGVTNMTHKLYDHLNYHYVRVGRSKKIRIRTKVIARQLIKEVGNFSKDGHFVFGLSAGRGPPLSTHQVFLTIMDTVGNSMLLRSLYSFDNKDDDLHV